ncbi:unnamed protein product [Arctogadus glacialis]
MKCRDLLTSVGLLYTLALMTPLLVRRLVTTAQEDVALLVNLSISCDDLQIWTRNKTTLLATLSLAVTGTLTLELKKGPGSKEEVKGLLLGAFVVHNGVTVKYT